MITPYLTFYSGSGAVLVQTTPTTSSLGAIPTTVNISLTVVTTTEKEKSQTFPGNSKLNFSTYNNTFVVSTSAERTKMKETTEIKMKTEAASTVTTQSSTAKLTTATTTSTRTSTTVSTLITSMTSTRITSASKSTHCAVILQKGTFVKQALHSPELLVLIDLYSIGYLFPKWYKSSIWIS